MPSVTLKNCSDSLIGVIVFNPADVVRGVDAGQFLIKQGESQVLETNIVGTSFTIGICYDTYYHWSDDRFANYWGSVDSRGVRGNWMKYRLFPISSEDVDSEVCVDKVCYCSQNGDGIILRGHNGQHIQPEEYSDQHYREVSLGFLLAMLGPLMAQKQESDITMSGVNILSRISKTNLTIKDLSLLACGFLRLYHLQQSKGGFQQGVSQIGDKIKQKVQENAPALEQKGHELADKVGQKGQEYGGQGQQIGSTLASKGHELASQVGQQGGQSGGSGFGGSSMTSSMGQTSSFGQGGSYSGGGSGFGGSGSQFQGSGSDFQGSGSQFQGSSMGQTGSQFGGSSSGGQGGQAMQQMAQQGQQIGQQVSDGVREFLRSVGLGDMLDKMTSGSMTSRDVEGIVITLLKLSGTSDWKIDMLYNELGMDPHELFDMWWNGTRSNLGSYSSYGGGVGSVDANKTNSGGFTTGSNPMSNIGNTSSTSGVTSSSTTGGLGAKYDQFGGTSSSIGKHGLETKSAPMDVSNQENLNYNTNKNKTSSYQSGISH